MTTSKSYLDKTNINIMEWDNKLYQLLLTRQEAVLAAEDWSESNRTADLRLRRARTPGHVVLETTDTMWAARIKRMYPSCRVAIKPNPGRPV